MAKRINALPGAYAAAEQEGWAMTETLTKTILILTGLAALAGKAYFLGQENVQNEWDKERADFAITQMQELAETQAHLMKLEENKRENLKTINTLSADLKSIRVRIPVHKCPAEGDLPNATSTGADGVAGSWQQLESAQSVFDEVVGELGQRAVAMDLLVEDCRVLQQWANSLTR